MKPESAPVTVYVPLGSAGKRKRPAASVTAVRVPCRAGDVIVTDAPGSGALLESVTVPSMSPVVWARATFAVRPTTASASTTKMLSQRVFILSTS